MELFSLSHIYPCFWALVNACGRRYGVKIRTQHGEDIEADIGNYTYLLR